MSDDALYKMSSQQILTVWDGIQRQHLIDQALTILTCTLTDMTREALAKLTLGQRNEQLLKIREQNFGPQMNCLIHCSYCRELMEFVLPVRELYTQPINLESQANQNEYIQKEFGKDGQTDYYIANIADYRFEFRLINSEDLLYSLKEANEDDRYQALLKRSLRKIADKDGTLVKQIDLPSAVLQQYNQRLIELDPLAEILITLTCAACDMQSESLFDIVGFLAQEIETYAKQLLQEVHLLASAYGWAETSILAMSKMRRQYYLGKVIE